jgi:S1-C subfamily serine protease
VTHALFALSEAIASLAAGSAAWLTAIRVGSNQHATGIAWGEHSVVATDRALPALDSFALVMPGGHLAAAKLLHRDAALNLALLRLDRPRAVPAMTTANPPPVGSLAIVVGADADATPTVRVAALHRHAHAGEHSAVLDLHEALAESGSLVLDATGAVLGMVQIVAGGVVAVMPHGTIGRFVETAPFGAPTPAPRPAPIATPVRAPATARRGWFGVALQPITVPEPLVPRAGQASGRLVVGITVGGPAEQAGLRVGDVLLSLDGHTTSGPNALRAFLEGSRIGNQIEVRILRDGNVATARLTVGEQP